MVNIQSPTAEIRRGKKERRRKKEERNRMKIYMVSLFHRATIIKFLILEKDIDNMSEKYGHKPKCTDFSDSVTKNATGATTCPHYHAHFSYT